MKYIHYFVYTAIAMLLWSCTDEFENPEPETFDLSQVEVRLQLSMNDYSDNSTRAATYSWKDGDVVYLRFFNGSATLTGVAKFNAGAGDWKTSITGSGLLKTEEEDKVEATLFVGNATPNINSDEVTITPTTAVYQDLAGTYQYSTSSKIMTIKAKLAPLMGRLRFKGTTGQEITVDGLTFNSYFDVKTAQFSTSTDFADLKVQSDGYTPYLYGSFTSSTHNLDIDVVEYKNNQDYTVYRFNTQCYDNVLAVGKSGYMNIPTVDDHNGWMVTLLEETINGYKCINLGLSVKWATCNVGASTPEGYGNYYAWGETSTKSNYSNSTSTTYGKTISQLQSSGILDNNGNLTPDYDAASKNWGGTWRMPTKAEIQELIDNCTTTWTIQNGVYGRKVSSKKNGNSIFIPAAGYRDGSSLSNGGSYGIYWSSSPYEGSTNYAYNLYFRSSNFYLDYDGRYYGQSVRPAHA